MDPSFVQTLILCIVLMFILFLVTFNFIIIVRQMDEVKTLLYNRYVHFDPKVDKVVDLAIDCWRLKKYIDKAKPQLSPENIKRINNTLNRIENYLRENDIEINDYTGRIANDGINIDIVSVEQDKSLKRPIIKETIVPAVLYKGSLRKKSQVVILDNSLVKEQ